MVQRFFCEFCNVFKNTIFTEHLWMTASILQQQLVLYFPFIYRWQHSSGETSLVGKKLHPYISRIFQIQIFFFFIFFFFFVFFCCFFLFSLTKTCLLCWLQKAYAILGAANRFVGMETHKHNAFEQLLKIQIQLFPRNTRFLSVDFCEQGNGYHSTSKLLKCDLVQTLNTFQNPSLRIFAAGKASLVVNIFGRIFSCFNKVFLISLRSTEQLLLEIPLHRCFLHNDHWQYFQ